MAKTITAALAVIILSTPAFAAGVRKNACLTRDACVTVASPMAGAAPRRATGVSGIKSARGATNNGSTSEGRGA